MRARAQTLRDRDAELDSPRIHRLYEDASPLNHVSAGDPPAKEASPPAIEANPPPPIIIEVIPEKK